MVDVELFDLMRKESKKRRASHRANAPKILAEAGIEYDIRNNGAHVIVTHDDGFIDFWPGTGKWIVRSTQVKGRGIKNLLKHMGVRFGG